VSSKGFSFLDLLNFPVSCRKVYLLFGLLTALQIGAFSFTYLQGQPRLVEQVLVPFTPGRPVFDRMIYGEMGEGMLNKPMAVTWAHDRIYVSDTGNHRVQVFDNAGNLLLQFGEWGTGAGQFTFPYGLAATADRLFVADLYTGRILTFDLTGQFLGYFAEEYSKDGRLQGPGALFLSGDRLYVTDIERHRVLVFAVADGSLLQEVGMEEDILAPNGVAVDANGYIYVSSAGRQRVAVYSPTGQPIRFINGTADGHGQSVLFNSRGLAVTRDGRIFVVSKLTNQIFVFNSNGEVLYSFGALGSGIEQFTFPNGLFMDPAGRLLITDTVNRRVVIYRL